MVVELGMLDQQTINALFLFRHDPPTHTHTCAILSCPLKITGTNRSATVATGAIEIASLGSQGEQLEEQQTKKSSFSSFPSDLPPPPFLPILVPLTLPLIFSVPLERLP
jgi:hypothetical protein